MKKLSLFLILLICAVLTQAQIATNIYWVKFTDKANSPYSIDNPEEFLSARALERRARLNIAIDEYDIPVNPQYLQAVADCGAQLLNPSKWLNGVSVYTNSAAVVAAINELEFVETVRNCPNFPEAQREKERWLADEMKIVENSVVSRGYYGGAETQVSQLRVNDLHNMGYDGTGIVIAVLDGGFIGTDIHSCFDNMRAEGRFLGVRDFVYGSESVYSQSTHGTSCFSTMGAYDPNNMVGTAPKASYYLFHTEDGNGENIVEEYNWVSGAELADSLGVDVCSTSLGYITFDMPQWDHPFSHFDGHTAPMTIGAEIAASRGMLCMNSAGNAGEGTCTLGIPADAEHIITVGAVDANGYRADFSSVGPTYDGRIKPDVMAMGEATYVASGYPDWQLYYNGNGTSFSCPVLAGAMACLRQACPNASVQEICDAVRAAGNNASSPNSYDGYGIPDFTVALAMLNDNVNEVESGDEIVSVYPNPSNGVVKVAVYDEVTVYGITVYGITGNVLFNTNNINELETTLNALGSGVYTIRVNSELGSQTMKVVICK
ncbi:MAG: S8 family peptidase [Bacteroidales bacterium]|nr:S8 family peptidase [Bacteroidales bacterium]